ncbi:DUF6113 family protein [Kitasatospora viridis]|uniref:Uncharacterized protein n=1 Tax=Kitasatospora viridis TaxID=281105 RepID=A0A561UFF0_9ACTN|nr:DUF6113 family protein [Kitasatospora viridis]TWF98099.1 hypothetical protein FHX73_111902 [Kitasatospora viridis]
MSANPLHRLIGSQGQRLAEPLPPRGLRFAWYGLVFLLGAVDALCGCFVQALWSPWGLLLALAANLAVFYGGLRLTATKVGLTCALVGWLLVMFVLLAPRPEGDFVLSSSANSYAYLLGGLVTGLGVGLLPTRAPYAFGIPRQRD